MAFALRWPKKVSSTRTVQDKVNWLKAHTLKASDLGEWQEDEGREELSHVIWADKALILANDIPDAAGLLIAEVRRLLPEVLRERIPTEFSDWNSFVAEIKKVSKVAIDDAMEKDKTLRRALEESRAATAAARALLLQQSPTAPLRQMLQRTHISQPNQSPATPQQSNPFGGGQMNPGNLFYNVQRPAPQTPQAPRTPQNFPTFRSNDLRLADARANALPHHPNTTVGKAAYAAQTAIWDTTNPGRMKPNEYCPYPLTPGTADLVSNECFGCGHVGHRANDCPAPGSIPDRERGWRAIAAIIYGIIRPRGTTAVNYIATAQQWDPRQQWYAEPRHEFTEYESQGNGEGPSN
jgi:hypothetical protein